MKKFLINITSFIFIVIVLNIFILITVYHLFQNISFKTPPSKNVLVLGDSNTECALNDSILSNYLNVSGGIKESYFYSYVKLKKIIKQNPQIDTVILSFNLFSMLKDGDDRINDPGIIPIKIPKFFPFIETNDFKLFVSNMAFYKSILKLPYTYRSNIIKKILGREISYINFEIGSYRFLNRNVLREYITEYQRKNNIDAFNENAKSISQYQLYYLNQINKECIKRQIKLILFAAPLYSAGYIGYHKNQYLDVYKNNFKDITFINYTDYVLPDSCYADVVHLNYKGAAFFSNLIKKNGLGELNKAKE